jgi:hypothetical protein
MNSKPLKLLFIIVLLLYLTSCSSIKNTDYPNKETEISNSIKTAIDDSTAEDRGSNEVKKYKRNIILNENLCANDEQLVFGFKVKNSNKILSICISEEKDYIVYRYGTKDKVELEFPNDKAGSWKHFSYAYYLRGGGKVNNGLDLNHIKFQNNNYIYDIYDEYSAEENSTSVGVIVTNSVNQNKTEIEGLSSSKIGSLIDLRWNSKIKQIDSWF